MPLAAWVALLTVGVVLLLVGALAPVALALIGRLAEENAESRVRLAAVGAAGGIEAEAAAAATAAELLAERPTLLGLISKGEAAELASFLERFGRTGGLDGSAVLRGGEVFAASPAELPWMEIRRRAPPGAGFLTPLPGDDAPLATGIAELPGVSGGYVLVLKRLDTALASRLSHQMALTVRILTGPAAAPAPGSEVERVYRSQLAVGDSTLWVEATLPAHEVAGTLRPLRRAFVVATLGASLLAVAAGALAGRRISGPLAAMRRAAQRIGSGDLTTPVPPAAGAETSALATALEEMRQRLRSLTAKLRRREAEAQALLSGIVEGVFAVDDERRIQYLNRQAATLLGVAMAEAVGRFCGDVLQARDASGVRPCEDSCPIVHARSRGSSRAVEHLHLPDGLRTVVITSAPPAGSVQVQVLRDETETEAARRSRDAVLANVSHELKTPLSAQLASIELLRDGLDTLEPGATADLVSSLERSTLRLTRLVDNLLESVRIETGQVKLRRLPVDLSTLLDEAVAMTGPLFEYRRQQLDVSLLPELPRVTGDPAQLTQVLVNLLANAQKYAPAGSTIRIGGSRSSDSVVLWVEDAGPGVPPALSESIFDRFHRGSAEGQGMGLGLWIAKSIVERHGGEIGVTPSPLGGARFTLTFPLREVA